MKVCILGPSEATHIIRWCSSLMDRGVEVELITSMEGELPGVKCTHFDPMKEIPHIPGLWRILATRRLRQLVENTNPDIVQIQYLTPMALLASSFAKTWPLVVSPWGQDAAYDRPPSPRRLKWTRRLYHAAHRIPANCAYLGKRIGEIASEQDAHKIIVLRWGADTDRFPPRSSFSLPPAPLTIGFAKHCQEKYGLEYLLRALKKVLGEVPETRLMVAGEGELKDQYIALAAELGITKSVTFLDRIPVEDMAKTMAGFDIFCQPSVFDSEVLGIAAMEAACMEIPTVATSVGGVPEVVLDGETGYVVPRRDSEALAVALLKLLRNPEQRDAFGKRGRERVLAEFRWDDTVDQMVALYEDLLASVE